MHLIITDAWLAKSRAIHLSGTKLLLAGLYMALVSLVLHMVHYHAEPQHIGWAREQAGTVIGALIGLITGVRAGIAMGVKQQIEQQAQDAKEHL